jgi:hypothetical protein
MFTVEFIEFVLGVPELLENGQCPDVVRFEQLGDKFGASSINYNLHLFGTCYIRS